MIQDPALSVAFATKSLKELPNETAAKIIESALRNLAVYNQIPIFGNRTKDTRTLWDEHAIDAMHFLHNEQHLLTLVDGVVTVWDIDSREKLISTSSDRRFVDASISMGGKLCAMLDSDGKILILISRAHQLPQLSESQLAGPFSRMWLSPTGRSVLCSNKVGTTMLADLQTDKEYPIPINDIEGCTFDEPTGRVFLLGASGTLAVWSANNDQLTTLAQSSRFANFPNDAETEIRKAFSWISPTHDEPAPTDANGAPFHQLSLTGYLTRLLMEQTTDESEKAKNSIAVLPYKVRCPRSLHFLPSVDVIIALGHQRSTLYAELWHVKTKTLLRSFEGLFSEISVHPTQPEFLIVGPSIFNKYRIITAQGKPSILESDAWQTGLTAKRTGVPRRIVHSPKGNYLASTFAPFMRHQGAPHSSVAIWSNITADARDGNDHFGKELHTHSKFTHNVTFSPSSEQIATYSADGLVRIWKIVSEEHFLDTQKWIGSLKSDKIYETEDNITLQPVYYPKQILNFFSTEFNDAAEVAYSAGNLIKIRINKNRVESLMKELDYWDPYDGDRARVSPGYNYVDDTYDPIIWNEELRMLVESILDEKLTNRIVLKRYRKIIRTHPLLLSGLQNSWAALHLADEGNSLRTYELVIVGLSGDKTQEPKLKELQDSSLTYRERKAVEWSIQFLNTFGKHASLSVIANEHKPESASPYHVLTFPSKGGNELYTEIATFKKTLENPTELLRNIALRKGGKLLFENLGPSAFYYIIAGKPREKYLGIIAELLMHDQKYERALDFAMAAQQENPNDANIYNNIGNIYDDQGAHQEAIQWYKKSIEYGRSDGWPQMNLAKQYRELGQLDDAESYYRAALEFRKSARLPFEFAEYLNSFAWFIVKFRSDNSAKLGEAYEASRESISIFRQTSDPKGQLSNFLDTFAAIHFAKDEPNKAVHIQTIARDQHDQGTTSWIELNETLQKYLKEVDADLE